MPDTHSGPIHFSKIIAYYHFCSQLNVDYFCPCHFSAKLHSFWNVLLWMSRFVCFWANGTVLLIPTAVQVLKGLTSIISDPYGGNPPQYPPPQGQIYPQIYNPANAPPPGQNPYPGFAQGYPSQPATAPHPASMSYPGGPPPPSYGYPGFGRKYILNNYK